MKGSFLDQVVAGNDGCNGAENLKLLEPLQRLGPGFGFVATCRPTTYCGVAPPSPPPFPLPVAPVLSEPTSLGGTALAT